MNITVNPPDAVSPTYQKPYSSSLIAVLPRAQMEAPRLLNYLTAPNVVIWSAACASCALSGLFSPVEVLAKDRYGNLHPWNPSGQTWSDGESPEALEETGD